MYGEVLQKTGLEVMGFQLKCNPDCSSYNVGLVILEGHLFDHFYINLGQ